MDSHKRIVIKAVTWQVMGLIVMTVVGYLFTGSIAAGGGIALVGAIIGFVSYVLHELLWSKVRWGRRAR